MFAAGACANRLVVASGLTSLTGTLFGDLIIGSDRADRISAGAGDDCLEGRAGKDVLRGGPGADRMRGGGGDDTLSGEDGNDRWLRGEAGNDRITGGAGNDGLYGGAGNDMLNGGAGNDALSGGSGDDVLVGGAGKNTYAARDGDDIVNAANGVAETVNCGSGNDRATVDKGDRVIGCERVTRRKGTNGDTTEVAGADDRRDRTDTAGNKSKPVTVNFKVVRR